jgi:hypothetical protein
MVFCYTFIIRDDTMKIIKKITIELGGQEIEVTIEELRQFRNEIDQLLGDRDSIPTVPTPVHPVRPYPYYPDPWVPGPGKLWYGDKTEPYPLDETTNSSITESPSPYTQETTAKLESTIAVYGINGKEKNV